MPSAASSFNSSRAWSVLNKHEPDRQTMELFLPFRCFCSLKEVNMKNTTMNCNLKWWPGVRWLEYSDQRDQKTTEWVYIDIVYMCDSRVRSLFQLQGHSGFKEQVLRL